MIINGKIVYVFEACGWDVFDARDYTPADGTLVVKTQPAGCPRNGTMNHCYIAGLDGEFIGLVHQGSLRRATAVDMGSCRCDPATGIFNHPAPGVCEGARP